MPIVPSAKLGVTPRDQVVAACRGVSPCAPSKPNASNASPLARYAVCRRLRKTLFGETLLCRDVLHPEQKKVVLKRIGLHGLQDKLDLSAAMTMDDGSEHPLRERQVARVLQCHPDHPHIVSYEREHAAFFVANNSAYLVMEYCNQGDLYELMEQQPQNRLPERQALRILYQIAEGVAFLHANGIAHRDLSPENVLLHNGVAKICDFGLSCKATSRRNEAVGKLYYMAPECAHRESYNPKRVDIWSLGMMLFVLLTGSPLITDERTRDSVYHVIRTCGIAKVLQAWGMEDLCSNATLSLLTQMLQVDPQRRPRIQSILTHRAFTFLMF